MDYNINELGFLDKSIYGCITSNFITTRVIITNKQLEHIFEKHPDAYEKVLIELKNTLKSPDYIFKDNRHSDTGLVTKSISTKTEKKLFVVVKICTDSKNTVLANSVISGWTISEKRFQNYLKNKEILYKGL